jgi:hypothetical protein
VWFEDFGGRDDSAEEAYLAEVDSSTIYVAILNERYGRRASDWFSATHAEYRRAHAGGKRISIWVAGEAPNGDGDLAYGLSSKGCVPISRRLSMRSYGVQVPSSRCHSRSNTSENPFEIVVAHLGGP